MFAYIRGTAAQVTENSVILETGGVGFRILAPYSVLERIHTGDEVKLYTHFSVREDAMQLFGFRTEDELRAAGAERIFHSAEELGEWLLSD